MGFRRSTISYIDNRTEERATNRRHLGSWRLFEPHAHPMTGLSKVCAGLVWSGVPAVGVGPGLTAQKYNKELAQETYAQV